jgi:hypothetical protein
MGGLGQASQNPHAGVAHDDRATDSGTSGDCADGLDNDGDGWVDGDDPDCVLGSEETGHGSSDCNDGADNDGDSYVDAQDQGCDAGSDADESDTADCNDGLDKAEGDEADEKTPEELMDLVRAHLRDNRPQAARAILEPIIDAEIDQALLPEARYRLAETWFNEGRYQQAILRFEDVVAGHASSPWASWAMVRQGDCFAAPRSGAGFGGRASRAACRTAGVGASPSFSASAGR